jgi:outer membrane protein OmpA-like peptidoglycan-associated protein
MKSPAIASVLSLVLGGGLALADTAPKPSPPQPAQMDVLFDTDSAALTYANDSDLKALADWAKCKKTHVINLSGHADPRGTIEHNTKLSANRAEAVANKLIDLGTPRDRVIVTVYGELGERRPTFAQDRRVTAMPEKVPVIVGTR